MKLVIWGLGFRGKTLVDCLKNQYVAAIIESDPEKIGQKYRNIEIISFERYMKDYQALPVIITPGYQFQIEIEQQLIEHNIFHFVFSSELPPNIRYNGKLGLNCYWDMFDKSVTIYLYGINAFAVVLYLMLVKYTNKIVFIIKKDTVKKNQTAIIELLQLRTVDIESIKNFSESVYLTTYEKISDINDIFGQSKVIDAFRYAESRKEYRNLELKKFHNLYIDKQRCFIVATGPSLTIDDLNILHEKHMFCFSVNSMCNIEINWKPDVYVVLDGKFFLENQKVIRDYSCPIKLLPDDNIEFWREKKEGEYQVHRDTSNAYGAMGFSEDITRIVNTCGTVTVGCIQIAVYMGFKEIYLLGTDCNYTLGSTRNHFGGDDKPDMIDHSISSMLKGYQMCRDYADTHGIKIYNATRGGMLEVFERVDFDSLFDNN